MSESGNSSGIVAVVAIFVLVVIVGFFGVQSGMFNESGGKDIDIKVEVPEKAVPKAP